MAGASGVARVVERVERACDSPADSRSLRVAVLDELRSAITFDGYAWLLTDPVTEVGCSPLADVPWLAELPRQIRLKYQSAVNRWTSLKDPPVSLLRRATSGRPEASLVWRDLLRGHGVSDTASVVFRDRYGCWSFLELWRSGSDDAFTDADAELLTAITEPVTRALRRCQASTFEETSSAPARSGPVVLVLSPELDVRAQTPETDGYLRVLVPPEGDRRPIPAAAYNVAAQLLAVEAGVDDHPPTARVHLHGGIWLTLRAARIGEAGTDRDIAVTIETTSPVERLDLFIRAFGLSGREGELLSRLTAGADTRGVAAAMFVSEHTVQDHLKSIFAKTGAQSRRSLLARATGL